MTAQQQQKEVKDKFSFLNQEGDNLEGFNIGKDEQAVPFIRFAQPGVPQLKDNKPQYIAGLKPGDFFNTVTKEVLGAEIGVICGGFDRVFIEWDPDNAGSAPVAIHTPELAEKIATDKETFGKWKKDRNDLKETYMYYILLEGKEKEGIHVMSLTSTNITIAKKWNRLLLNSYLPAGGLAMPYYMVWKLTTVHREKGDYDWYVINPEFKTWINPDQYKLASRERQALPAPQTLKLEHMAGDGAAPPADSTKY